MKTRRIAIAIFSLPFPLMLLILFCGCLIPLFIFGADTLNKDNDNNFYYISEKNLGGYKLSGKGLFLYPLPNEKGIKISSGFGDRVHPVKKQKSFHSGIDIPCAEGTNVVSVEDGIVIFAGVQAGYGNFVMIQHNDGYITCFGHLSKILVKTNQSVSKSQIIALSGNTGVSTGAHLHFEVRKENTPVDPAFLLGLVPDIPDVLPADLKYVEINIDIIKKWLNQKNSIFADGFYCEYVIKAAKEFDINPLLLFAITGQEQSFVPRTSKNAVRIANNPFNVYHSWYEYNTDIYDSSRIACRTIINLSQGRPETVQPILWINRKYAKDKNWWIGVSCFFETLEKDILNR